MRGHRRRPFARRYRARDTLHHAGSARLRLELKTVIIRRACNRGRSGERWAALVSASMPAGTGTALATATLRSSPVPGLAVESAAGRRPPARQGGDCGSQPVLRVAPLRRGRQRGDVLGSRRRRHRPHGVGGGAAVRGRRRIVRIREVLGGPRWVRPRLRASLAPSSSRCSPANSPSTCWMPRCGRWPRWPTSAERRAPAGAARRRGPAGRAHGRRRLDQFEECWTSAPGRNERDAFLAVAAEVVGDESVDVVRHHRARRPAPPSARAPDHRRTRRCGSYVPRRCRPPRWRRRSCSRRPRSG